ncbi:MAG TPA: FAD:protein FMN transferase [Candidatus Paceibacterota bacterium]|nr:FAD:protein FMN transferase [Candidatus Paceibacterota bacterium]
MPITIEVVDDTAKVGMLADLFAYFSEVDERFSTYKETSEIMSINRGELQIADASTEMQEVFALAEKTKAETDGYFNMQQPNGSLDPSGIVKGWAIFNAANLLRAQNVTNFYIDAGGDIESSGNNEEGLPWSVGIKNPFKQSEIVKVIYPKGAGIATSGSYIRGSHIYNPHNHQSELAEVVSLSVIGPNVLEADRFATAVFAMGKGGIAFIESLPGFEGYAIDKNGVATMTHNFEQYTNL